MKFEKSKFNYHGGYLTYNNRVVARFKHCPRDKGRFVTFLIKNFTVKEYFEKSAEQSPAKILQEKGYVSTTVRMLLKAHGFPQTVQGFSDYLDWSSTERIQA